MRNYHAGQGATEYLVLLAVVLVVALVLVALLGFFPGMASDAQLEQSRLYWSSAYPISITQAVAADTAMGGYELQDDDYCNSAVSNDAVVLTLKNNGATPVQLIAVTGGGWIWSDTIRGTELDGDVLRNAGMQYQPLAPADYDIYRIYIMPPKGTGYNDEYTSHLVLSPGEEVTIAYDFPVYDGAGVYSANVKGCRPAPANYLEVARASLGQMSKTLVVPQFNIYYISTTEGGGSLLKKQVGAKPLVMVCQESITLP